MSHAWVALVVLMACNGSDDADDKVDADADTDTDADSDSDTDADSDADADTDVPGVDADGDGFDTTVDCDDADETVFPGAPDLCGDERVTNCDRTSDDGLVTLDGTQGFDDLGDALVAAASGSEILVCAGTHVGPFEATVPVRLVGFGDPAATFLDGDTSGTTLTVPGGSEIVGLTITRGNSNQSGGGIRLTSAGTLLLEDTVVTGNRGRSGGGLAIAEGAVVTLIDSRIEENIALDAGGGVLVAAGAVLDLTVGSSVSRNTAEYYGGGVHLDGGALVGGVVDENQLSSYAEIEYYYGYLAYQGPFGGAGVSALGAASVTGTDIVGNVAVNGGGGVASAGGELILTDVSVHENTSDVGAGFAAMDGTLRLDGTTEVFENSGYQAVGGILIVATVVGGVVRDNTAGDFGGGIVPFTGTVDGTLVTGNHATRGGGIFVLGQVVLRNTTISGNVADDGAGIGSASDYYLQQGVDSLVIEGSTISGNVASRAGGGSFLVWPTTITDTTFEDNTAETGGAMVFDRAPATMFGGSVLRNVASEAGGGVWINGTTFGATGVNFGTDADDNLPGDVFAADAEVLGYGAAATFSCDDGTGCTP